MLSKLRLIPLRMAWRLLWRDSKSGELNLLVLSLATAVAVVTGITIFSDRIDRAFTSESSSFLAADQVISGTARMPSDWAREVAVRGLKSTNVMAFPSMVFAGERNQLVAVKAVAKRYPLRGQLIVADKPFEQGTSTRQTPSAGEVWLDSRLFPSLGVRLGDKIELGHKTFLITRVVISEPDKGGDVFGLGPRLLMNINDVPATGLVQPGSRVNYRTLLSGGEAELQDFQQWLQPQIASSPFKLLNIRNSSPSISHALQRAENFLLLGGLLGVILAGVAIALVSARYSKRHFDQVAILKTLGETPNRIVGLYIIELLVIGCIAITLGLMAGMAVQAAMVAAFSQVISIDLPPPGLKPFLTGASTGAVCLITFALPPFLALRSVHPARVLRRDFTVATGTTRTAYATGIVGGCLLLLWYSKSVYLSGSVLLSMLILLATLLLMSRLLLFFGRFVGTQAGSTWRLALAGIQRRGHDSVVQMLTFSIVLMLALLLWLVRNELLADWDKQLPDDVANHFLLNITADQKVVLKALIDGNAKNSNEFFPSLRGRMTHISGEPIKKREARFNSADGFFGGPRADSERNLTWAWDLPVNNQLIAGQWWDKKSSRYPMISIESYIADLLHAKIGEIVRFQIADRTIEAEIGSIRKVRWDGFRPNFYIIFSPGVLESLSSTWITSFYLPPERKMFLNTLLSRFPTVTVIEIDKLIEQVQSFIARMTLAIQLVLALVLVTAGFVLLASISATMDQRRREYALLFALGADRSLLLRALIVEFSALGLGAGVMGVLVTEVAAAILWEKVFLIEAALHPSVWLIGIAIGVVSVALLGFLTGRRVLYVTPVVALRYS